MEKLILVRHAESEYSVRGLLNGDPAAGVGLTEHGEEQARQLGRELADAQIDLGLHTGFPRTCATLELVLAGRDVPVVEERRLADPRAGSFEGRTLDEYRAWAWNKGSREQAPGGGESRLAIVQRYVDAYRDLLGSREETILAVVHALPIAYLLLARDGGAPRPRMDVGVELARPYPFSGAEVERSLGVLRVWCVSPTW
jgi:broad specificity phosphatase PhoE